MIEESLVKLALASNIKSNNDVKKFIKILKETNDECDNYSSGDIIREFTYKCNVSNKVITMVLTKFKIDFENLYNDINKDKGLFKLETDGEMLFELNRLICNYTRWINEIKD